MKMVVEIDGKKYEICYSSGMQRRCEICAFSTFGKGVICRPCSELPDGCPLIGDGTFEGYYFKEV